MKISIVNNIYEKVSNVKDKMMSNRYMLKFKEGFCEIEKGIVLSQLSIASNINSFGFYVINMTDDEFFSYKKHTGILYIKRA